ncbi:protein ESMERALDA 1 [Zea mays]|nr:protein ESMERALDA 1 [Zea mays]|eukprot:XP_008655749.2 protein ESMERALDA 1 [Zea mays]
MIFDSESQLIYWDSKVSEADMNAMWKHPDVYKEWIKSGERRGNVRFSHDAKNRPYLSRVEVKDMIALSCVYDGGDEEKEMDAAREIGWRRKFTKRGRVIRPGIIRMNGKCPLTPLEVGLMLRGMGSSNKTAIFLASGKIYKAEKNMASLLEMLPLLQTKETLASEEELAPFKNFSSRMAAVDYSICAQSEVFVTTQGGNFPYFLMGHRRYLYGGHSKTIKPDKRRLAVLFNNPRIGWTALKRHLLNMRAHSDVKGIEMKRPNESIYTFRCPDCMCRLNRTEHSKSKQSR